MTSDIILDFSSKNARIIPDTTIQCRYCKAVIELDSKICVDYYLSGILGMVCPECGCFTRGVQ